MKRFFFVVTVFKDVVIFSKPVSGASEQAMARFLSRVRRAAGLRGQVVVLVAGNRELRALNRRFRHKDRPTDVLSFPSSQRRSPQTNLGAKLGRGRSSAKSTDAANQLAGDIAISAEIAIANAARLGHRVADELKTLILHGVLHLAGYDHEADNGEMSEVETRLRRELRLPDSLIQRNRVLPSHRRAGNLAGRRA